MGESSKRASWNKVDAVVEKVWQYIYIYISRRNQEELMSAEKFGRFKTAVH